MNNFSQLSRSTYLNILLSNCNMYQLDFVKIKKILKYLDYGKIILWNIS